MSRDWKKRIKRKRRKAYLKRRETREGKKAKPKAKPAHSVAQPV